MRERGVWLDNNHHTSFSVPKSTTVSTLRCLWYRPYGLVGLLSSVMCACVSPRDAVADTRKVIIAS